MSRRQTRITNPLAGRQRNTKGAPPDDIGQRNKAMLGALLRERRLDKGLTQLDVGRALGVTDGAVSAIELGRNPVSPERYRELADALSIGHKTFAKVLLRYYDPWLFSMLFPDELPAKAVRDLPERRRDLRKEDPE